jgi:hypothetical protein
VAIANGDGEAERPIVKAAWSLKSWPLNDVRLLAVMNEPPMRCTSSLLKLTRLTASPASSEKTLEAPGSGVVLPVDGATCRCAAATIRRAAAA